MIKDDKRYEDFIKFSIDDLKNKGVCYLYHKYQIEEIKKIIPNIEVIKDLAGLNRGISASFGKDKK